MHRVEPSVLLPYSAERMFRLVERVDDYPQFLPWCPAAHARPLPDGSVEATIEIAFHGVRTRFTTRNVSDPPRESRITLVDGPFGRLIAPVFDSIAGSLIDAFARRAESQYG